MKYLYGNGKESDLDQNYLEFMRLVLDFAVAVLRSESTIVGLERDIKKDQETADLETGQLKEIAKKLDKVLNEVMEPDTSVTAIECINNLRKKAKSDIQQVENRVTSTLERSVGANRRLISSERAANLGRLEKVLLTCDMPKSASWVNLRTTSDGRYSARLESTSEEMLHSITQLMVPAGHLFSEPIRVERLIPEFQMQVPKPGTFGGAPKISPVKLGKEYVYSVTHNPDTFWIELRNAIKDGQSGYTLAHKGGVGTATLITKGQAGEPHILETEDLKSMLELYKALIGPMEQLRHQRHSLLSAESGGVALGNMEDPVRLVKWLVAEMTPVVRAISRNSLSPTELVLKRVLGDDRREELFASKAELARKLEPLSEEHRALFNSLKLDDTSGSKSSVADSPLFDDSVAEIDLGSILEDSVVQEVPITAPEPKAKSGLPRPSKTPPRPSAPPPRPSKTPPPAPNAKKSAPPRPPTLTKKK